LILARGAKNSKGGAKDKNLQNKKGERKKNLGYISTNMTILISISPAWNPNFEF